MKKHYFTSILLCASLVVAFAQTRKIAEWGDNRQFFQHQLFGSTLMGLYHNSEGHLVSAIDLSSGNTAEFSLPDPVVYGLSRFNENGMFYVDKGEQHYYINHITPQGNRSSSVPVGIQINQFATPHGLNRATIFQQKYYVNSFLINHKVWESDGSAQGSREIMSSQYPIAELVSTGDRLLVVLELPQSYQFWHYNGTGEPEHYFTLPKSMAVSGLSTAALHDGYWYFNTLASNGATAVRKTNGTEQGTEVFVTGQNASAIHFFSDYFLLATNDVSAWSTNYYWGAINQPGHMTLLEVEDVPNAPASTILKYLGGKFFLVHNAQFGIEPYFLTSNWRLSLLKDLTPGPAFGVPSLVRSFPSQGPEERAFTVMTNGSDPFLHWYVLTANTVRSVCPTIGYLVPDGSFEWNNSVYWLQKESLASQNLTLLCGSVAAEPSQPELPHRNMTWVREVDFVDTITGQPIGAQSNFMRPQGLATDHQNNIFVITAGEYWRRRVAVSGHQDWSTDSGGNALVKFNQYGEVQWMKALSVYGFSWQNVFHRIAVDKRGDLWVIGVRNSSLPIDGQELSGPEVPFANMGLYLVKLDGQTGDMLWGKTLAVFQGIDKFRPFSLLCDEDDNAYLILQYQGNGFQLNGVVVPSRNSPGQVFIKFNSDGRAIWAQNASTPWQAEYCVFNSISYHQQRRRFYTLHYREFLKEEADGCAITSSQSLIQEWDTDGQVRAFNVLESENASVFTSATATPSGKLLLTGYHNSSVQLGAFTSQASGECDEFAAFSTIWDITTGLFENAYQVSAPYYVPIRSVARNGYLYVLVAGGWRQRELMILKYDADGRLLGYKKVARINDSERHLNFQYFDVRNGYMAVLTSLVRNTSENSVFTTQFPFFHSAQVIRIADADWQPSEELISRMPLREYWGAAPLRCFPNPTSDRVHLYLRDLEQLAYDHYEIWNMQGQLLGRGEWLRQQYEEIRLDGLPAGTYVIRLVGQHAHISGKVVKY